LISQASVIRVGLGTVTGYQVCTPGRVCYRYYTSRVCW